MPGTVIPIDLKPGMHEDTAPEVATFTSGLSNIENLYQPTIGMWEKFPGLTSASTTDGGYPLSLIQTRTGFALVTGVGANEASYGHKLSLYSPTQAQFFSRMDTLTPAYSIRHSAITSQPFNRYIGGTSSMFAFAANTTLDAVIVSEPSGTSSTEYYVRVIVVDRATGNCVYAKQVTANGGSALGFAAISGMTLCFNGDVLFGVVSYGATPNGLLRTFTCTPKNGDGTGLAYLTITEDSKIHTSCPQPSGTGVFIIGSRLAAHTIYTARLTTTPTLADSATDINFTNTVIPGMDTQNGSSGYVWISGRDNTTGELRVLGKDLAVLATNTFDDTVAAITVGATSETYLGSGRSAANVNETRIAVYTATAHTTGASTTAVSGSTVVYKTVAETVSAPNVTLTLIGTLSNWHPVSDPHYCNQLGTGTGLGTWSMQVSEDTFPCAGAAYGTSIPVAQNVLLQLTDVGSISNGVGSIEAFAAVANVESFLSFRNGAVRDHTGKLVTGSTGLFGCFYTLLSSGALSVNSYRVDRIDGLTTSRAPNFSTDTVHTFAQSASGTTLASAAAPFLIDQSGMIEPALFGRPGLTVLNSGGTGTLTGGVRNYVAIWRGSDAAGNTIFSRISEILTFTNSGVLNDCPQINVSIPQVTFDFPEPAQTASSRHCHLSVDVYRTAIGGTVYRLLNTIGRYAGGTTFTFTDAVSDATLASKPKLYRQPGTQGTPLERWNWQPGGHVCSNRDRLFWISPDGRTVFYTGFYVYGESPWCSPAYRIEIQQNLGKAVALASMDDRLIVLAENGAYVIDGEGPPENGGNGSEFSQPRIIANAFGCVAARSVQVTPLGIFYRSNRGVELLDRGLSNKFIGEPVESSVLLYPGTNDSCFDQQTGCYMLLATDYSTGGSRAFCFQIDSLSWSVRKRTSTSYEFFRCCTANVQGEQGNNLLKSILVVATGNAATSDTVYLQATGSTFTDAGAFVGSKMESHWIHPGGSSGRHRIKDLFALGRKVTNHKLTLSLAYDYSSSYTQTVSWEPAVINAASIEHFSIQPNKDQPQAIRFKIEDAVPTDTATYPITTGSGVEFFGVSVNAEPIEGEAKLPAAQRG